MRTREETEGLTKLGRKTKYEDHYAPELLETFFNKHEDNDYFVKFNCPEFKMCIRDRLNTLILSNRMSQKPHILK